MSKADKGKPRKEVVDVEGWAVTTKRLLGLEQAEEREQLDEELRTLSPLAAQSAGLSLLSLVVLHKTSALFGRTKLVLGLRSGGGGGGSKGSSAAARPLPASHRFRVGDEVTVSLRRVTAAAREAGGDGKAPEATGVVSKVTESSLEVMTNDEDEILEALAQPSATLRLDLRSNDATHKKLVEAVDAVCKYDDVTRTGTASSLRGVTLPKLRAKCFPLACGPACSAVLT